MVSLEEMDLERLHCYELFRSKDESLLCAQDNYALFQDG